MNQEMKNRLLRLNSEALVEILDSVCGSAEIELNFGQDPDHYTNEPVFYAYEPHCGSWTVLNYDPATDDKPKEMPKFAEFKSVRFVCNNNLKQKQDNGCGCYQDPPCRGCKEEAAHSEKTIDITPTWPEMVRIIAALMESGTDTGKRAAFEELKRMADVMTTYRIQRDEAIIHANNVVRESSCLITAKIPSGSGSGYWNAVANFRHFESKTT